MSNWFFGISLLVLGLAVAACQSDQKSAFDLEIGDCIVPSQEMAEAGTGKVLEIETVKTVDCAELHDGEVIAVFNSLEAAFPGDDAMAQIAAEGCPSKSSLQLFPTADSWREGDREIACILESIFDLGVGDCIDYVGDFNVSRTSCSDRHDAEVLDLVYMPDGVYPSEFEIDSFAIENCPFATDIYIGPTIESWERDDRQIICLDE